MASILYLHHDQCPVCYTDSHKTRWREILKCTVSCMLYYKKIFFYIYRQTLWRKNMLDREAFILTKLLSYQYYLPYYYLLYTVLLRLNFCYTTQYQLSLLQNQNLMYFFLILQLPNFLKFLLITLILKFQWE